MSMVEDGLTHPEGEGLFNSLLWIHGIIRSNLQTIQEVITSINAGAPADEVRKQIEDLSANSAVWQLRINCMRYCRLVHMHHGLEDASFFPALCQANPALQPVVDKLQADHLAISDYLDAVEEITTRITESNEARVELVDALNNLALHLITHLDYEEANLEPTLRRLYDFPMG